MSLRQMLAAAAALVFVLHLPGCDRSDPVAKPANRATDRAPVAEISSAAWPPSAEALATPPFPLQQSPDYVLRDWGAAIERRDWAAVRALWGHGGADSGLSPQAFAARWDRLRHPRVTVGSGEQEGAAGSLFYTAPVTITDGPRIIAATVTLRRVNDVPGASAAQLRWHFDPMTHALWTDI